MLDSDWLQLMALAWAAAAVDVYKRCFNRHKTVEYLKIFETVVHHLEERHQVLQLIL